MGMQVKEKEEPKAGLSQRCPTQKHGGGAPLRASVRQMVTIDSSGDAHRRPAWARCAAVAGNGRLAGGGAEGDARALSSAEVR